MRPAKLLFESSNFRPEILAGNAGQQVTPLYMMSEEFMLLARSALNKSGFWQRGMINYSAGIFCLGHALELTYKILLLKDRGEYPKWHNFGKLYELMEPNTRNSIDSIVRKQGWDSCDEFHEFMDTRINLVKRKYYDTHDALDIWGNDLSGSNIGHELWPQLVCLCERLHQYVASTIWINPSLPSDERESLG